RDQSNSNKMVTSMPSKVTFSRFPEESNVDTSSGIPKKLAVSVTDPSAFSVSLAPRKESNSASRGGTIKGGGDGGTLGGDEDGGGRCGDGCVLRLTVKLPTLPKAAALPARSSGGLEMSLTV